MTKSLLNTDCLQQLNRCKRILIGYSGGLDSTVLLHLLSTQTQQLAAKLIAVHINHGISPNAQKWQEHCQQVCNELKLPLIVKKIDFDRHANIEDAARRARYTAFEQLLKKSDCLILGHHLNDQAETLLLHLFRGTGVDGLAGMAPAKKIAQSLLLRPLLQHTRETLESYADFAQLKWIDDESNQDVGFSRNYLRHQILPQLTSRWPGVVANLARTSEHCQQAQANLDDLAKIDCPSLKKNSNQLSIAKLTTLSEARLTNVLRVWLKENKIRLPATATFKRLIKEIIYANGDRNPQVSWDDICIRRYQETLYLVKQEVKPLYSSLKWFSFPNSLILGEGLATLSATSSDKGLVLPPESTIEVRFRQGGESFYWHGQSKQLKKLLQEWHVPPWMRDRIPLLYINNQLACVIGYAISDIFYQSKAKHAYQLHVSY